MSEIDPKQYVSRIERAVQAYMAGDKAKFFDDFAEGVNATEFLALMRIQYAAGLHSLSKEIIADDRYQKILKIAGLDAESLAKLNVTELPF